MLDVKLAEGQTARHIIALSPRLVQSALDVGAFQPGGEFWLAMPLVEKMALLCYNMYNSSL